MKRTDNNNNEYKQKIEELNLKLEKIIGKEK